jgi:hypothetical protein
MLRSIVLTPEHQLLIHITAYVPQGVKGEAGLPQQRSSLFLLHSPLVARQAHTNLSTVCVFVAN